MASPAYQDDLPPPKPETGKRVAEAAAAILLLERRAVAKLRKAVLVPVATLPKLGGGVRHVETGIRTLGRKAITDIRLDGAAASSEAWTKATGLASTDIDRHLLEAYRADERARALAEAWATATAEAQADGETAAVAMRAAVKTIDSSVYRTAATESVDAWNDETRRRADFARAAGYRIAETWEAILDRRTCSECAAMEGKTVLSPERFPDDPPLHPRCRCFLSTQVVQ